MKKYNYCFTDLKEKCDIKYKARGSKKTQEELSAEDPVKDYLARARGTLFHYLLIQTLNRVRPGVIGPRHKEPPIQEYEECGVSIGDVRAAVLLYADKITRMSEFFAASRIEYECQYTYDEGPLVGTACIDMVLYFQNSQPILYDFKTHEHPHYRLSLREIDRRMNNYAYDLQAACYKDIFEKSTGYDAINYYLIFCKTDFKSITYSANKITVDLYRFSLLDSIYDRGYQRLRKTKQALLESPNDS